MLPLPWWLSQCLCLVVVQSQASSAANPVVANAGGLGSPPKKANGKQSTGSKNDKASDVQALSLRQSEADWETAGAKKVNGKQSAGSKNDGASRNMMQGSKIHNGHSAAAETSSGAGTKPDGGQSKKAEASPSKQRRPEASPKKAPGKETLNSLPLRILRYRLLKHDAFLTQHRAPRGPARRQQLRKRLRRQL